MNMENSLKELSKGCRLCQQGRWLCIFLTYKCSAKCHFCAAPFKDDRIISAFGSKKEEILNYLLKYDFEGISFSGGDPFIVFDRLMEWFIYFKKHLPDYYYWVYTNGLDADKGKLEQLASAGMDEIRFNIAATGYISQPVWESIKISRGLFPFVSVEIPSIKKDSHLLEAALEALETIGVDYLNLHDYILSESDAAGIDEKPENFILNKTSYLKYAPSSLANTGEIINKAFEKGYHFQINHCSMQQKELQMTSRRIKMGKIFCDPEYDLMLEDGTICNYYDIISEIDADELKKILSDRKFPAELMTQRIKTADMAGIRKDGHKIIKASYIPKMEVNRGKILLGISII